VESVLWSQWDHKGRKEVSTSRRAMFYLCVIIPFYTVQQFGEKVGHMTETFIAKTPNYFALLVMHLM
jgi:hypothetical protein